MFSLKNEISKRGTQNVLAGLLIQTPGLDFIKNIRIFMCRKFGTTVIKRDEWNFLTIYFTKEGDIYRN
jgi:hypothetical protein